MKRQNDQKLKDILKAFVNQDKVKPNIYQKRIESIWNFHMGKSINNYTKAIKLRDQVLFLTIESAPLKNELNMGKSKLIQLINDELGEQYVKDIYFY